MRPTIRPQKGIIDVTLADEFRACHVKVRQVRRLTPETTAPAPFQCQSTVVHVVDDLVSKSEKDERLSLFCDFLAKNGFRISGVTEPSLKNSIDENDPDRLYASRLYAEKMFGANWN